MRGAVAYRVGTRIIARIDPALILAIDPHARSPLAGVGRRVRRYGAIRAPRGGLSLSAVHTQQRPRHQQQQQRRSSRHKPPRCHPDIHGCAPITPAPANGLRLPRPRQPQDGPDRKKPCSEGETRVKQSAMWTSAKAPSLADMEARAHEVFARLPGRFRRLCEGLIIRVEDFPTDEVLDEMKADSEYDLLGLFQGTGLPFQSQDDIARLPN